MHIATKIRHRFSNKVLKDALKRMPEVRMRIGWEKDQMEKNGKIRTVEVAFLQETGFDIHHKNGTVTHVVARPMLGLASEVLRQHWHNSWRILFRKYLVGDIASLDKAAQMFCEVVIADIRNMVEVEKPFALNRPSVEARKNGKPPLIDTGNMIETLTFETTQIKK